MVVLFTRVLFIVLFSNTGVIGIVVLDSIEVSFCSVDTFAGAKLTDE